jgi:RNA polymerase sigma-70 factor (ECF subfamily)
MFQVANSILLSHLRRSRVVSITAAANLDHLGLAAPEPSAEKLLECRDELRELTKVLDLLPKPCREAFLMRRVTGLSQRETAMRLGISEKTVEKYMAKGVRLLMDVFGRGGKLPTKASNLSNRAQIGHDKKIVEPGN